MYLMQSKNTEYKVQKRNTHYVKGFGITKEHNKDCSVDSIQTEITLQPAFDKHGFNFTRYGIASDKDHVMGFGRNVGGPPTDYEGWIDGNDTSLIATMESKESCASKKTFFALNLRPLTAIDLSREFVPQTGTYNSKDPENPRTQYYTNNGIVEVCLITSSSWILI